jgi:uncharacterized linocin/CFP29 family protein
MEHNDTQLQWTEEQWNLVQQTVRDEARKLRVAASFLPLYGPLSPDTESVALQKLEETPVQRPGQPGMKVDDVDTRPLTTISVNVELKRSQVSQPDLSSALMMFRRAANIIARVEDRIVFMGQPKETEIGNLPITPKIYTVSGGEEFSGLITEAIQQHNIVVVRNVDGGGVLVNKLAEAIGMLENKGHLGPFALVLGRNLFIIAHTPNDQSLVLPADRINPLLNGPLLRSSTIDLLDISPEESNSIKEVNRGVLVSLAGNPIDLVVARDISVQFLQITTEPRYVYRVSQRFTLRIKQVNSIIAILPNDPGGH